MEDAANHVRNDMSEIGHELPKKVTHPKIGFNLYMLNGIFIYCIKRFVSRNNISFIFYALSRNLIYDMYINIIRNMYFDIELLNKSGAYEIIFLQKFTKQHSIYSFIRQDIETLIKMLQNKFSFSRDILYISLFFRFQRFVVRHVRKFVLFWTGQKS